MYSQPWWSSKFSLERKVAPSYEQNKNCSLLQTWHLLMVIFCHLSGRNVDPTPPCTSRHPLDRPMSNHIHINIVCCCLGCWFLLCENWIQRLWLISYPTEVLSSITVQLSFLSSCQIQSVTKPYLLSLIVLMSLLFPFSLNLMHHNYLLLKGPATAVSGFQFT